MATTIHPDQPPPPYQPTDPRSVNVSQGSNQEGRPAVIEAPSNNKRRAFYRKLRDRDTISGDLSKYTVYRVTHTPEEALRMAIFFAIDERRFITRDLKTWRTVRKVVNNLTNNEEENNEEEEIAEHNSPAPPRVFKTPSFREFLVEQRNLMGQDFHTPNPSPDDPRRALQKPDIARFFHHYITSIAPWYDLSDESAAFGTLIPRLALDSPLLFSAVIALSAMQKSKTGASSVYPIAEFYHGHCIRLLIALDKFAGFEERETALAAACLLRTYEIQDEETDPGRHLQGAFSLASSYVSSTHDLAHPLLAAGFWNYLREDITHSLLEQEPLKMDLTNMPLPTEYPTDQTWLNKVSLILGQTLNHFMSGTLDGHDWNRMQANLSDWHRDLPAHFSPFSKSDPAPGEAFPRVWMLRDCHGAARHYFLVTLSILTQASSKSTFEELKPLGPSEAISKNEFLEACALEIVGIAFTSGAPAVLVNAFGPIAFYMQAPEPYGKPRRSKSWSAFSLPAPGQ
ncbi:hypothetical protein F5X68DRAFT_241600 [Plectosphaerella plurivora]|uniref:Uncharacterized protein n=1 Tax=Plectosphaerella plurivora TaxID=936078 RepID=A0A9P8VA71_9PEZI|nr:hypothetical protein F5X68DRAFT_241600 [Plectosphaerella plurivora]